jgi:hypothetical protein
MIPGTVLNTEDRSSAVFNIKETEIVSGHYKSLSASNFASEKMTTHRSGRNETVLIQSAY